MKYAVKVYFEDQWLYISEGPIDELRPLLFDTLDEAKKLAKIWRLHGHEEKVEAVEFQP
jgi:hypothetical protein